MGRETCNSACFSLFAGFDSLISRACAAAESLLRDDNPANISVNNFPDPSHMESRAHPSRQSGQRQVARQAKWLVIGREGATLRIGGGLRSHAAVGFSPIGSPHDDAGGSFQDRACLNLGVRLSQNAGRDFFGFRDPMIDAFMPVIEDETIAKALMSRIAAVILFDSPNRSDSRRF